MPVVDGSFGWRWLVCFRRLNQCQSASDGLALKRLAFGRNGCGLQVYEEYRHKTYIARNHRPWATSLQLTVYALPELDRLQFFVEYFVIVFIHAAVTNVDLKKTTLI